MDFFGTIIPDRGLTLLASRPGVGKTCVLYSFALKQYAAEKKCASIYMSDMQKKYRFTPNGISPVSSAYSVFAHQMSLVFLPAFLGLDDLIETVRQYAKSGVDAIIIDSIDSVGERHLSRTKLYSEAVIRLKQAADEYGTAIILACPVSRNADQRKDKHPKTPDLLLSSQAANAADKILFLYPENFYYCNIDQPPVTNTDEYTLPLYDNVKPLADRHCIFLYDSANTQAVRLFDISKAVST